MKKVIYPRCPATVSGKHKWLDHRYGIPDHFGDECPPLFIEHPVCGYCDMIDDTITLEIESVDFMQRMAHS